MSAGLHIISLPHTQTTAEWSTCAYTMKVRKFAKMMTAAGWKVTIYSGQDNDAPCHEHVQLISEKERRGWFGPPDPSRIFAVEWEPERDYWMVMNHRAVAEIVKRAEPHDLVLLTMGHSQYPIRDSMNAAGCLTCEPGVGYVGVITHAAFESAAWMHHVYGILGTRNRETPGNMGGRPFDTVIPNYFDPADFSPDHDGPDTAEPYLLYMGRVTQRKGPHVAAKIAEALGMRLLVAGPGVVANRPGELVGEGVTVTGDHFEYLGALGFTDRAQVMTDAMAILVPTLYLEPFGGVAVEAMMCGTPAVASDWGAFRETVEEGVSGYRFSTLQEGIDATRKALTLDRDAVRQYAFDGYSLDAVAPMYERWFGRLDRLWRSGWDDLDEDG